MDLRKVKSYCFLLCIYSFFTVHSIQSSQFNKKEEQIVFTQNKTSRATNKDSLSQRKYSILYKKYKKKEYFETLKEALKEYELSISKENKYLFSLLIADIYNKTKNYQNALFYYKNSLQILKLKGLEKKQKNNIKNIIEVSKINLRIGSAYQKLTLNDSAVFYYTKVEKLNSFNPVILKHKASTYTNLSGIFERDSLFEKAKEYALQAMNIHSLRKDKVNQANSLNNLGNIYLSQKKFKQAKNIYLQGIDLIKNDNSPNSVRFKANLYYNLAWAMRNLKDYKAYDYQELSYEIEDNQREKEVRRIIEEVTVKHKENLEQQKINLVTEQRKLAETQDSKTSLLFGALSLLVIIISGVVVYNYKLRQKNLQLKLSENNLKQQQSLEKLKSDTHTKILNATIDAKESERKQIAEILHDNVSALLSSANMHLSATKKQFSNNAPQEIEKTQAIILEASQKVRDLSHNLISSILLKFGLEYALKDVVKKYSNSQLKFEISAQNINRYNQEFEIKIFNIIQELANNILKHSKASLAQIIIKQEKNKLTILVNDNGIGFNTSATAIKNTGIGLNQIEARLEMMNGKLSINSATNKGTKISITIPIQQQKPFKLSSVS